VTGPTGSGKSTLVAALLNEINTHQSKRILTVEKPIEFVHASKQSLVVQREIGTHTLSLQAELGSAAHQDVDVVFAGEFEDRESIVSALNAAEAGILVIATLRGSTATRAMEHIVGVFPEDQRQWTRTTLSTCLKCVCAQVLVSKADGKGRCAVNEILVGNTSVAAAIRDDHIAKLSGMIQAGGQDGMITMDDALMRKVEAKMILPADALVKATDKGRFQALLPQPVVAQPVPENAASTTPQTVARR